MNDHPNYLYASSSGSRRFIAVLLVSGLAFALSACRRNDAVTVSLDVQVPHKKYVHQLEIHAQVAGTQAGLRYKWFAQEGDCDPQESEWPQTIFRFAEGVVRDRVTVEVWRESRRVAFESINVAAPTPPHEQIGPPPPKVRIVITTLPPSEPGGPNTHTDIAGKVIGELIPECRVVLYACSGSTWYIQPLSSSSHAIAADGSWSTWTHTGTHYAALVVRSSYNPAFVCDVLPQVGDDVLARTIVEGLKP